MASLFYTAITLVTALKNWLPVFHLQWLSHVPHSRHRLPTTIVWNSPMQELIGPVIVSSLVLPAFGTYSLLLYFWLPSKGRSITTLGTRWHDFFYHLFIYFTFLFYSFYCLSFPFLGMQTRERAHCARSAFPFFKKKKKKKKKGWLINQRI